MNPSMRIMLWRITPAAVLWRTSSLLAVKPTEPKTKAALPTSGDDIKARWPVPLLKRRRSPPPQRSAADVKDPEEAPADDKAKGGK